MLHRLVELLCKRGLSRRDYAWLLCSSGDTFNQSEPSTGPTLALYLLPLIPEIFLPLRCKNAAELSSHVFLLGSPNQCRIHLSNTEHLPASP